MDNCEEFVAVWVKMWELLWAPILYCQKRPWAVGPAAVCLEQQLHIKFGWVCMHVELYKSHVPWSEFSWKKSGLQTVLPSLLRDFLNKLCLVLWMGYQALETAQEPTPALE
ncbi:hypothetical protein Ancab_018803, partial [Ancistrocladus abbreviatus]